jgi:hypothetical protein
VVVARSKVAPVTTTRPLRLEIWRGEGGARPCVPVGAQWGPRGVTRGVGRRQERAEGRARGRRGNGTVAELERVRGSLEVLF